MKKTAVFLCILMTLLVWECGADSVSEEINGQADMLDLSQWQNFIDGMGDGVFQGMDLGELIRSIASGQTEIDGETLLEATLNRLSAEARGMYVLTLEIVALGIFSVLVKRSQSKNMEAARFCINAVSALMVCSALAEAVSLCRQTLEAVAALTGVSMSVILPLIVAAGGTSTAAVLQPSVALLSSTVGQTLRNLFLPVAVASGVLSATDCVFGRNTLRGFADLLKKAHNWLLGIVFTILTGVIGIKTLASIGIDGVSLRAFKYTVGSSVPVIGGMFGDGIDLVLSCTLLLKNAAGICSVICLFLIVVGPMLRILAWNFALKGAAALLDGVESTESANTARAASDTMTLFGLQLLTASVMVAICMLIVISAGNVTEWVR